MHEEPFETVYEARPDSPGQRERNLALIAHLGIFASGIAGPLSILVPLVIYLQSKDESAFVAEECKEAINFQITLFLVTVAGVILTAILIGIAVLVVVAIAGLVLPILAAIAVSEGRGYRYPSILRLVR